MFSKSVSLKVQHLQNFESFEGMYTFMAVIRSDSTWENLINKSVGKHCYQRFN